MLENSRELLRKYQISEDLISLACEVEEEIRPFLRNCQQTREYNQWKVLEAFHQEKVSEQHLIGSTGYGYNDLGREGLDRVLARIFKTEDAFIRHQIVSGTQACFLGLYPQISYGDGLLSITGEPYDTIQKIIKHLIKEKNIAYGQVSLNGKTFALDKIKELLTPQTKVIFIQRSCGYQARVSLTVKEIGRAIASLRDMRSDLIFFVDNCYGEFVEAIEPAEVGADLVAGSLIKNPGGGIAPTGGYVAGKSKFIEKSAAYLTAPGLGKEVGPTLGLSRLLYQGLFFAPQVVGEALSGMTFASRFFERLGYDTTPHYQEKRADIIQALHLKNPETLIKFCQGIQKAMPVDSHVKPEPAPMPGYEEDIIMAAGTFNSGSSIELTADAPIREPYTVYLQGGLSYEHIKLALLIAAGYLRNNY